MTRVESGAGWCHRYDDQTRFCDLDAYGHCNHAIFSGFFESARISLLHEAGLMPSYSSFGIPIVRLTINYRRELRFPERVMVATSIGRIGQSSLLLRSELYASGDRAATCEATVVHTDLKSAHSTPWPQKVRQWLQSRYCDEQEESCAN